MLMLNNFVVKYFEDGTHQFDVFMYAIDEQEVNALPHINLVVVDVLHDGAGAILNILLKSVNFFLVEVDNLEGALQGGELKTELVNGEIFEVDEMGVELCEEEGLAFHFHYVQGVECLKESRLPNGLDLLVVLLSYFAEVNEVY
jgi:hypothetical protein